MTRPPQLRQKPEDRGAVAVSLLITGMIVIVAAAALIGGGSVLAARSHGYSLAQSAARAGAQHIDLVQYRSTGQVHLDPARAAQAAKHYLAGVGATGTVDKVTQAAITVTASSRQPTPALRTFGYGTVTVTATASAAATVPITG